MIADSREKLGEAMRVEKLPNCCARHERTVWFDGEQCPCCKIIAEMQQRSVADWFVKRF